MGPFIVAFLIVFVTKGTYFFKKTIFSAFNVYLAQLKKFSQTLQNLS